MSLSRQARDALGPKIPSQDLMMTTTRVLEVITGRVVSLTPDQSYLGKSTVLAEYENALHEICHHIALGDVIDMSSKIGRTTSIGVQIENLTPMMQDANELDALAIELEASWWLGRSLNQRRLVMWASKSMTYLSSRQAQSMVTKLRFNHRIQEMGLSLAQLIREEWARKQYYK